MNNEVAANLQRLQTLMLELKQFSAKQLEAKLREQLNGNPPRLDPFYNVERYLEGYRDMGVLQKRHEVYTLTSHVESQSDRVAVC